MVGDYEVVVGFVDGVDFIGVVDIVVVGVKVDGGVGVD